MSWHDDAHLLLFANEHTAYAMEEGFDKVFLTDSFSMSLCFGVVQFVDNLQVGKGGGLPYAVNLLPFQLTLCRHKMLESVEAVGLKIKRASIRYPVCILIFLVMFFWFPVSTIRFFHRTAAVATA
jgi:hypothetical protein